MGCHTWWYRRVQDSEYIYIIDYLKKESIKALDDIKNPKDYMIEFNKEELNNFKSFFSGAISDEDLVKWHSTQELVRHNATVLTIEYTECNSPEEFKHLLYDLIINCNTITNKTVGIDLIFNEFDNEFYIACETYRFIRKDFCNNNWLEYLKDVKDPGNYFRSTEYDHWICTKDQLKEELFKDSYYIHRQNKEQSNRLNNYDRLQIENLWNKMIELYGDVKIKFA